MKIDLHTHCLPISRCSIFEPEQMIELLAQKGIDAIVLTNHYKPEHLLPLSDDPAEQARIYLQVFERCRAKGEELGLKVFFGAEVKLGREPNCPEFLLYGFSQEDFIASYPLYDLTQEELFEYCNQKDILMVQAHPFRTEQGYAPADMRFMHGVEVYNPHPYFATRFEDALAVAEQNGKLKTAGSDLHMTEQLGPAGIIAPDDICDQFALRDYLRGGKVTIFTREKEIIELD